MIAEAIDTVFTLGWALLAWIVLTAVAATAALYAVVVVGWAVVRGVWRACGWLYARVRASDGPQAPPMLHETPEPSRARPVPSWAHTQPINIEEAA